MPQAIARIDQLCPVCTDIILQPRRRRALIGPQQEVGPRLMIGLSELTAILVEHGLGRGAVERIAMPGFPNYVHRFLRLAATAIGFCQRKAPLSGYGPAHLAEPGDLLLIVESRTVDVLLSTDLKRRHEWPVGAFAQKRRHLVERHILVAAAAEPGN